MSEPVRVRFAPSPTGFPHVGNIRTALFNWLYARHTGGRFVVRIEDTDVARTVPGAIEVILDGLRWLGLDWDEGPQAGGDYGPYFQSARLELYHKAAQRLVEQGDAYYCYCSPQRLGEMRAEQARKKQPPGYDRACRNLSREECARFEAEGIMPVVRFKVPSGEKITFHDLVRGDVTFDTSTIDDFVLLKSDGYPTYHLANIVDDHEMKISHVLRAEEWLSSTPRHLMLYRAMGYQPPLFAHLPMILGTDRSKLSKRHGAVSIIEYREQGYLPEAMLNFLALLGWSLDATTEIFSHDELVRDFTIERISPTAAIFNKDKLDWMNGVYIRKLSVDDFAQRALPFLEKLLPADIQRPLDTSYVKGIMPLVQERTKTLAEVADLSRFFFTENLEYDTDLLVGKGMTREMAIEVLESSGRKVCEIADVGAEDLEADCRALTEEMGLKPGQFFGTVRVAVTGRTATPPLFQTMSVLGRERCAARITAALQKLRRMA